MFSIQGRRKLQAILWWEKLKKNSFENLGADRSSILNAQ